jgi:hypothetical protein
MGLLAMVDRPPKQSVLSTVAQNPIDVICTLGDLDQFMLTGLADLTLPNLGMYGNHDSGVL